MNFLFNSKTEYVFLSLLMLFGVKIWLLSFENPFVIDRSSSIWSLGFQSFKTGTSNILEKFSSPNISFIYCSFPINVLLIAANIENKAFIDIFPIAWLGVQP